MEELSLFTANLNDEGSEREISIFLWDNYILHLCSHNLIEEFTAAGLCVPLNNFCIYGVGLILSLV